MILHGIQNTKLNYGTSRQSCVFTQEYIANISFLTVYNDRFAWSLYIDAFLQDDNTSIAIEQKLLQSFTKPSTYTGNNKHYEGAGKVALP